MERAPKNIFTNSTPDPVLKSKQKQDTDEEEKNQQDLNDKPSPQFMLSKSQNK